MAKDLFGEEIELKPVGVVVEYSMNAQDADWLMAVQLDKVAKNSKKRFKDEAQRRLDAMEEDPMIRPEGM